MFLNSSSSSNASHLPPPYPSSSTFTFHPATTICLHYQSSFLIFITFSFTNIFLLLPLCILVLYLAFQLWQKQKKKSASMATNTNHTDVLSYHVVAMEMISVCGCGFCCCGAFVNVPWLMTVGLRLFSATSYGEIVFHILTCVERHLAVVHPITYLSLRKGRGVRIRNIIIGCVWLFYVGFCGLAKLASYFNTISSLCFSSLSVSVISFSSISVLCALIRPGPGERGGDRKQVGQSKMRAFYTIMAIMGALLLRVGGNLFVVVVYSSSALSERVRCGILVSAVWFSLPSSLMLPLLFLHRARKLICCKNNSETGQGPE